MLEHQSEGIGYYADIVQSSYPRLDIGEGLLLELEGIEIVLDYTHYILERGDAFLVHLLHGRNEEIVVVDRYDARCLAGLVLEHPPGDGLGVVDRTVARGGLGDGKGVGIYLGGIYGPLISLVGTVGKGSEGACLRIVAVVCLLVGAVISIPLIIEFYYLLATIWNMKFYYTWSLSILFLNTLSELWSH